MLWGVRAYGYVEVVNVGLLYQWGRKDGFPGTDGSTIDADNTLAPANIITIYGADGVIPLSEDANGYKKVNITSIIEGKANTFEYAIKNPLTFIYSTAAPRDWYATLATNQDNTLWGEGTVGKSAYDPCPKGWQIAQNGTWSDFTRTENAEQPLNGTFPFYIQGIAKENGDVGDYHQTNGSLYKATSGKGTPLSWYPAGTGQISWNSGTLNGSGRTGLVWSKNTEGTNAYRVYGDTKKTAQNAYYRAYGYSVRCIQE